MARVGCSVVLKAGVVGVGRWGKNHARVLYELQSEGIVEFSAVCDIDIDKAREIAQKYLVPTATANLDEFARRVDVAIVATPIDTLYSTAKKLLEAGIDLLIEKPVATTAKEAQELYQLAERMGVVAVPGFIMRFNPVTEKMRELAKQNRVLYAVFRRLSRRPPQARRYSLLLDLAVHDIDLCFYILNGKSGDIESITLIRSTIDDIVVAMLKLDDVRCLIHVDGLSLAKVREIELIAEDMFVRGNTDELTIQIKRSDGTYTIEKISGEEPLKKEDRMFLQRASGRNVEVPDLSDAVRVLEIIDKIRSRT